jgi:hypothetical protein
LTQNQDLFFALRGGGGGMSSLNFALVRFTLRPNSLTLKN